MPPSLREFVVVERSTTDSRIFAHTRWDAIPAAAGLLHCAEHHFRPKVHWTRMQAFRNQILDQQRAAGVRVIKVPHALGFLDPDLPPVNRPRRRWLESEPAS